MRRRLGKAWVIERARPIDVEGWRRRYRPRPGRVQEGYLSAVQATQAMGQAIARHEQERARERRERGEVSFNEAASAWLDHGRRVRRWKPSVARDYEAMLYAPDREARLRGAPPPIDPEQAKQEAGDLLAEPDLLARFWADAKRLGLVGEEQLVKIAYLSALSCLLDAPSHMAVKGPSAGGKSFTVKQALRFIPEEAKFEITSMSDRALAYLERPLSHVVLVVYEAAGMASEVASYLIRSLLSEGHVKYPTVEKDEESGRLVTRERVIPGPTGLITTTTAVSLHAENETRLLSMHVDDSKGLCQNNSRILGRVVVIMGCGRWGCDR